MAFDPQSSFLKPTGSVLHQLLRYGLTGGAATGIDMGVLWLLTSCVGLHYQIGVASGYICGLAVTYLGATLWVFDEHRTERKWLEFLIFTLIGLIGLGATHLLMWFFTEICFGEANYIYSKIVTVILVSLLNFFLKKLILFTK